MKICLAGPFHVPEVLHVFTESDRTRLAAMPGMGGYCVTELALALRSKGFEIVVISLDPRANRIERFHGDGLEYIVCPRRQRGLLRDAYARERKYLREAISLSAADIVHAHWLYEYALGALDSGAAALITLHDHPVVMLKYLDVRWVLGALYALLVLRRGRHFTAVSPAVAKFARRISGKNVPVIPNCYPLMIRELQTSELVRTPFASGSLRLISLASAIPFKNAAGGLKAFSLIRRRLPDSEYLLAGPGLEKDGALSAWAAREGLDRGVRFMGCLNHHEVLRYVSQSDILLHPSLQDVCPNAVIEAMALGRLAVVARNWADAEWVVGEASLLVNGKKPSEMAEKVVLLVKNLPQALDLCRKGARMAEERFAPEKIVSLYEREYQAVIAQGR